MHADERPHISYQVAQQGWRPSRARWRASTDDIFSTNYKYN